MGRLPKGLFFILSSQLRFSRFIELSFFEFSISSKGFKTPPYSSELSNGLLAPLFWVFEGGSDSVDSLRISSFSAVESSSQSLKGYFFIQVGFTVFNEKLFYQLFVNVREHLLELVYHLFYLFVHFRIFNNFIFFGLREI